MESLSIATSILTRAVALDKSDRHTESLVCYQEGISILLDNLKSISDDDKKSKIRAKTQEYMERAEKVKKHIEDLKSKGTYREQIQVPEDAIGFSYKSVFSRFLDDTVRRIEIDDPYVRSPHQCDNLVRFLELGIKNCPKLKVVKLLTGKDGNNSFDQIKRLQTMRDSLEKVPGRTGPIILEIDYSDSLHDREIRCDNGWVIKIGRGLDYFKPIDRFNIGFTDYDLRPCRATTIDVFHKKELEKMR